MITASALKPHCGYARVLSKARPPTPAQQESMDVGTRFHAAVEEWIRTGVVPVVEEMELQGWIDLLASQWTPPPGTRTEIAWGLSPDGDHVHVEEPEPHVYRSMDGRPLLTAGRADACWESGGGPSVWSEPRLLHIVDYKTGRWPVTPAADNLQVNAAGIALARRFGARAYVPGVYYARDGWFDWGDIVAVRGQARVDIERGEAIFAAIREAALLDDEPRVGDWCLSCWEKRNCKAYKRPTEGRLEEGTNAD